MTYRRERSAVVVHAWLLAVVPVPEAMPERQRAAAAALRTPFRVVARSQLPMMHRTEVTWAYAAVVSARDLVVALH